MNERLKPIYLYNKVELNTTEKKKKQHKMMGLFSKAKFLVLLVFC